MCRIYTLLLLVSCSIQLRAQDKLISAVSINEYENIIPLRAIYTGVKKQINLDFKQIYEIDTRFMEELRKSDLQRFTFEIVIEGETSEILFVKTNIISPNAKLKTSSGMLRDISTNIYTYKGISLLNNHVALLSVTDRDIYLILSTDQGNFEVGPSQDASIYIGRYAKDKAGQNDYTCETDDEVTNRPNQATADSRFGDCLEVYIECDFMSFQDNGSSISNTEAWVLNMMNGVIMLYDDIGIPLVLSEIFIWDTTDPYSSQTTLTALKNGFKNQIQDSYNGRVAQLISTRPIGGGLADGIGGICGSYGDFPGPYAVVTDLGSSFNAFPNYSYNIYILAHEIGHIIGASHTHACVWNGDNSQIDDCGNVFANNNNSTPEGLNCFDENNPILPISGTIMSKCNDIIGVGIDFNIGFHPQVATVLFNSYSGAGCLTGGTCSTVTPSNDDCVGAIEIDATEYCIPNIYDNYLATSSTNAAPFNCGNIGTIKDVWFKVKVPDSGNISIETTGDGSLTNTVVHIYYGPCFNLTRVECSDDEGAGNHALVNLTGLTPDDYLYIRIIDSGSDDEGTFGLCAYDASLPCHPDYDALIDIYNAANGASWTNNSGWLQGAAGTDCHICTWQGIVCDGYGRVKEINLVNNNLSGNLSASIGDLDHLKRINIWNHNLSGSIPNVLTQLSSLEYLDLSNGSFLGSIPDVSNLDQLHTIYLENNGLTGTLPVAIANLPSINIFWAKNNMLSGCIPAAYFDLCDIQSLQIQNNEGLPSDGDYTALCELGLGQDIDVDGYCSGTDIDDDCDDTKVNVYPGAPEICDGIDNNCNGNIDEGNVSTNTWIGGTGNWSNNGNWTLGHIPQICENVVINSGNCNLQTGQSGYARSITISNAVLNNSGNIFIQGSDDTSLISLVGSQLNNFSNIDIYSVASTAVNVEGVLINNGNVNIHHNTDTPHMVIFGNGFWVNNNGSNLNLIDQN